MSRFLGYFFDSIKNKNSHQKNIPKFILTLTVRGRKLPLLSQSLRLASEDCPVVSEAFFLPSGKAERLFNIMAL